MPLRRSYPPYAHKSGHSFSWSKHGAIDKIGFVDIFSRIWCMLSGWWDAETRARSGGTPRATAKSSAARARGGGGEVPGEPLVFLKPSTSVIGSGEAIAYPTTLSQRVD